MCWALGIGSQARKRQLANQQQPPHFQGTSDDGVGMVTRSQRNGDGYVGVFASA